MPISTRLGHSRARTADPAQRCRAVLSTHSAVALSDWMDDPSPDVVRAAITRLTEIEGVGAAPSLRARLLSADLSVTVDIARALRRLGDGAALQVAIDGLGAEQPSVRRAAVQALGALGDQAAAVALGAALRDPAAGVRAAALEALVDVGMGPDAAHEVARLLSDPAPSVRIVAVRALARTMPRPGALLTASAGDRDWQVRLEIARHLGGLPDATASALLTDRNPSVREAAARAAGSRQVEQLAAVLVDDPASGVRRAAATTLGHLADGRASDWLISALEDGDAIVRAAVLRALVDRLTQPGAVRRISAELDSERPQRRRAVLYALAHLKTREPLADVGRLADDSNPDVRLAVLHVADALLADPRPIVRHLAADADRTVRDSAQNWLVRHPYDGGSCA